MEGKEKALPQLQTRGLPQTREMSGVGGQQIEANGRMEVMSQLTGNGDKFGGNCEAR